MNGPQVHTEDRQETANNSECERFILLVHAPNCDHDVRRSGERTDDACRRHEHQVPRQVVTFLFLRWLTIAGCHCATIATTVFECLF